MTGSDNGSAVAFGVFLIVMGALLFVVMRVRRRLARSSASWPTTDGTVLSSRVRSRRGSEGGRSFWPEVRYAYHVGGRRYESKRITFDEVGWAAAGRAQEIVDRYQTGSTVTVYVDPSKPSRSVLDPSMSGAYNYGVIGCALIAVGVFCVVFFAFAR